MTTSFQSTKLLQKGQRGSKKNTIYFPVTTNNAILINNQVTRLTDNLTQRSEVLY